MPQRAPQAIDGHYTYYAFISYSHQDVRWAKWLQKKLETYKLPTKIAQSDPQEETPAPGKLAPIFRDATDINTGPLKQTLREALTASKYLILLCSPRAAASPYVGYEVEAFRANGGGDRIIPVILRGAVNAATPGEECYPDILRADEDPIVGVDAQKLSRRDVLLKIVSRMLGLRFDELKRRDAERERKKRRRRGALLACALLVCLVGGYAAWDYFVPKVRYYEDYVEVYGLPVGLRPLPRDDMDERLYVYEITTTRGKVRTLRTLSTLNGQLRVINDPMSLSFQPIRPLPSHHIVHYAYYEDGRLSTVEVRDANDFPVISYEYSAGMKYMAFKARGDSDTGVMMPASVSRAVNPLLRLNAVGDERSDVTQHELTFDGEGRLVRSRFMRSNRAQDYTRDPNGVGGMAYAYNDRGQITGIDYLDMDGQPYANAKNIAGIRYGYDEQGLCVSQWSVAPDGGPVALEGGSLRREAGYDALGRVAWLRDTSAMDFVLEVRLTYDDAADVIDTQAYDSSGARAYLPFGYSGTHVEYNADGFIWQITYLDTEGKPLATPEGPARYSMTLDARGNPTALSHYDTQGKPIYSADGAAHFYYNFDANGRMILKQNLDDEGRLQIGSYGAAQAAYTYDDMGRLTRADYLDAQGKPMLDIDGVASFVRTYDLRGNVESEAYFGVDGSPVYTNGQYARVAYTYDDVGNALVIAYFGTDGSPVSDDQGVARYEATYDERGQQTSLRCLNTEGDLCMSEEGHATVIWAYDERGNMIRSEQYDEYERPLLSGSQGARVEYAYDKHDRQTEIRRYTVDSHMQILAQPYHVEQYTYDDVGNLLSIAYLGPDGEPVLYQSLYHRIEYVYDARGRITDITHWDTQGLPAGDDLGVWRYHTIRDEQGNASENIVYEPDGALLTRVAYTRDPAGRILTEVWLDADGQPKDTENYTYYEAAYDSQGRKVREAYYDVDRKPTGTKEYAYDAAHRQIMLKEYDESGKLVLHQESVYDARGRLLRKEQPYIDPRYVGPGLESTGSAEYRYDERGNTVYWALRDSEGNFALHADGFSYATCTYDARNNPVEEAYYDAEGNPVMTAYGFARIKYGSSGAYNDPGSNTDTVRYDERGNVIPYGLEERKDASFVYIAEVMTPGQANSAGVHVDDIVLEYGPVRFYDREDFDAYGEAIMAATQELSAQPKTMVVYRPSDESIRAFSFREGMLGVRFVGNTPFPSAYQERWEWVNVHIRGLYEAWLEQFATEAQGTA